MHRKLNTIRISDMVPSELMDDGRLKQPEFAGWASSGQRNMQYSVFSQMYPDNAQQLQNNPPPQVVLQAGLGIMVRQYMLGYTEDSNRVRQNVLFHHYLTGKPDEAVAARYKLPSGTPRSEREELLKTYSVAFNNYEILKKAATRALLSRRRKRHDNGIEVQILPCRSEPELFFVSGKAQHDTARLCVGCTCRYECLDEALEGGPEVKGVWGGMTEAGRRAYLKKNKTEFNVQRPLGAVQ